MPKSRRIDYQRESKKWQYKHNIVNSKSNFILWIIVMYFALIPQHIDSFLIHQVFIFIWGMQSVLFLLIVYEHNEFYKNNKRFLNGKP
jgi:hypothetical protein